MSTEPELTSNAIIYKVDNPNDHCAELQITTDDIFSFCDPNTVDISKRYSDIRTNVLPMMSIALKQIFMNCTETKIYITNSIDLCNTNYMHWPDPLINAHYFASLMCNGGHYWCLFGYNNDKNNKISNNERKCFFVGALTKDNIKFAVQAFQQKKYSVKILTQTDLGGQEDKINCFFYSCFFLYYSVKCLMNNIDCSTILQHLIKFTHISRDNIQNLREDIYKYYTNKYPQLKEGKRTTNHNKNRSRSCHHTSEPYRIDCAKHSTAINAIDLAMDSTDPVTDAKLNFQMIKCANYTKVEICPEIKKAIIRTFNINNPNTNTLVSKDDPRLTNKNSNSNSNNSNSNSNSNSKSN